jgi:hypothetical protein
MVLLFLAKVPGTKFMDNFLSRKTVPGTFGTFFPAAWMPLFPLLSAMDAGFWHAQGIGGARSVPEAQQGNGAKRNPGKPGPAAQAAGCAQIPG